MKQFIYAFIFMILNFYNPTSMLGQVKNDKMNVYFISGLGADKRVFQNLNIDPKFNVINIEWIDPKRKETIEDYAGRLISQIDTDETLSNSRLIIWRYDGNSYLGEDSSGTNNPDIQQFCGQANREILQRTYWICAPKSILSTFPKIN
jgi:hypothetical protein